MTGVAKLLTTAIALTVLVNITISINGMQFPDYSRNPTVLYMDIGTNNHTHLQAFQKAGGNLVFSYGVWTSLHVAAARSKPATLQLVINDIPMNRYQTYINWQHDHKGRSPLHCAVENLNVVNVELLLAKKAETLVHDFRGDSPLDYAYHLHAKFLKTNNNTEILRRIVNIITLLGGDPKKVPAALATQVESSSRYSVTSFVCKVIYALVGPPPWNEEERY